MHRAIETRYKGRRFRSRLEARYAVLFETLGVKWDYEPEGFELGAGLRYLPDFFVHVHPRCAELNPAPGAGWWVEIKAEMPTEKEMRRMSLLAGQTGFPGVIIWGSPRDAHAMGFKPGDSGPSGEPRRWRNTGAPLIFCSPYDGDYFARLNFAIDKATGARFEFKDAEPRE